MDNIFPFLPFGIITAFAIIVMLLEVFVNNKKEVLAYVALTGIGLASVSTVSLWSNKGEPFRNSFFNEMFVVDSFSLYFYLLFFASAAIATITSVGYLRRDEMFHSEFYSLLLFAVSGMMLMASGGDLITLFLGLEIMSIAIYVLVGFRRHEIKSNEAVLKYFFLGAFSAGFILYGIALLYGATGHTALVKIGDIISSSDFKYTSLATIGMLLILVGTLFKVAAFPFHTWTPDVYDGAPSPVTGFMISAVKAASFAMFLKIFLVAFIDIKDSWVDIIKVLSVLTMITGNIFAISQTNIKRMLAYSSISHTGYLLLGIASLDSSYSNGSANAILYYLVSYSISNIGAFACISYLSQKDEKFLNIDDYAGVGFKYPLIGLAMLIFMLSMIGVPPTAGFFGKYYLFSSAMSQGMTYMVLIALVNSMVSIYYYLKVVATMYLKPLVNEFPSEEGKISTNLVLVYTMASTIWIGLGSFNIFSIVPGVSVLVEWSKVSIQSLF